VAKALLGAFCCSFYWKNWCCGDTVTTKYARRISSHGHSHDHGRSALMITVGDTFHNFVDGVIIAAPFWSTSGWVVTSLAIIAHEIPQEIGDFLILLHSGYSRTKALLINLLTGVATMVGALLGYFALSMLEGWTPVLLGWRLPVCCTWPCRICFPACINARKSPPRCSS